MSDAAAKPAPVPDDATVVLSAAPDSDATMVVSVPSAPPAKAEPVPAAQDPTHVEFLRKVQARAQAKTAKPPPEAAAPPPPDRRKKAFFSPVVTKLVADGQLSQSDAISASLRARDQGITFLAAIAQISGLAASESLYRALAEAANLRFIANDRELLQANVEVPWLNHREAEQRGALVLQKRSDGIQEYAAIDPFDVLLRDWIAERCGGPVMPVVVLPTAFQATLVSLKTQIEAPKAVDDNLVPIDVSWQQETKLLSQPTSADVPLVVDYILQRCHGLSASDIHLEPTEDGMVVRARVDGILHEQSKMPLSLHAAVVSRIKVLGGMDVAERRRPQDGRIRVMIRRAPLDIRVSTLPTVLGEKVVMRLLDDQAVRPSPEQLGLRDRHLRLIIDKITAPHGMILISGPTGSGKTTTLYSCLSAADREKRNVVTIEDPVEYRLKGVHQMQVNEKIGLTFASGLRTILRQDPDVVMVGECRDAETAKMAVQAALTGHVVFSTIHANDCVGVVSRLLDMQIDPFLVASALSLSISQRLVRNACKHCSVMVEGREVLRQLRAEGVSAEKMARLGLQIDERMPCSQPTGCANCRHTGYSGRQAVFEMLEMTAPMRKLVISGQFDQDEFRELARQSGMTSMAQNGLQLAEEGRTTYAELVRVFGEI
ncbi:MAG: type II/IV secretion system protein [Alphaproteobacteria bacterium]|nr:type II/IV secretion system protein [Alphaproteobacteria bacterium]